MDLSVCTNRANAFALLESTSSSTPTAVPCPWVTESSANQQHNCGTGCHSASVSPWFLETSRRNGTSMSFQCAADDFVWWYGFDVEVSVRLNEFSCLLRPWYCLRCRNLYVLRNMFCCHDCVAVLLGLSLHPFPSPLKYLHNTVQCNTKLSYNLLRKFVLYWNISVF